MTRGFFTSHPLFFSPWLDRFQKEKKSLLSLLGIQSSTTSGGPNQHNIPHNHTPPISLLSFFPTSPRPSYLSLFSVPPLSPYRPLPKQQPISIHQNSQTHEKIPITANINTIQTLHPTPVRSAIRSMRFIVPLSRTRVLSKLSFILSARVVELVISADMASDIYIYKLPL